MSETQEILAADVLLDEHEVARRLCLSLSTLRNWRYAHRGPPFVKLGLRAVRYRVADVQAFVAAGERVSRDGAA